MQDIQCNIKQLNYFIIWHIQYFIVIGRRPLIKYEKSPVLMTIYFTTCSSHHRVAWSFFTTCAFYLKLITGNLFTNKWLYCPVCFVYYVLNYIFTITIMAIELWNWLLWTYHLGTSSPKNIWWSACIHLSPTLSSNATEEHCLIETSTIKYQQLKNFIKCIGG